MKNGVQMINDHRPVETFLNGKKIAGSKVKTFTGTSLSIADTYNDSASLKTFGKTIEIGEGDKSPDNPYELKSVEPFDLVSTDNAGQYQAIHMPYTLRSLPDGTRDYIEIDDKAKTAKLVQNIMNFTLNGNESWFLGTPEFTNTVIFGLVLDKLVKSSNKDKLSSSHFVSRSSGTSSVDAEFVQLLNILFIRINKTRLATLDVAGFKAWLTANLTTVQCQLNTPIITELDYEAVKTYYPYTQIYTNAEIQPTIEATLKVFGRTE